MGLTEQIAATHLGKKSKGSEFYDKTLLVAVPRIENRSNYEIEENNLPFKGFDIWNAYEFSSLTEDGVPYTRVLKIRYSCDNEFIVESKSLKLYLNSFNMSKFGKTIDEGLRLCKEIIEKDLSEKLQTKVECEFLPADTISKMIFTDYNNIKDFVDLNNIKIEHFKEAPEELKIDKITDKSIEYKLKFDSVRSLCKITSQPDYADCMILYKSKKHISEESLLKYLSSFRKENHFHEECVEMIFKRLSDILDENDSLMVCAMYTRRGGIDINPCRFKNCDYVIDNEDVSYLHDLNVLTKCNIKQ